jgi:branched-chain amino acid transport system permease protein
VSVVESLALCVDSLIPQPPQVLRFIFYSSVLSMLALGLTLTYMTTKVPNFSHAIMATFGMYIALLGKEKILNIIPPYPLLPLAIGVGIVIALSIYLGVLRPLANRGANIVHLMIATIAIEILATNILIMFTDYLYYVHKVFEAKSFLFRSKEDIVINIFGSDIRLVFILAPLITFMLIILLYIFLNKTKLGIAMRAVVENSSLSEVLGIPTVRIYIFSWIIAGALAGLAGFFYPMVFNVNPNTPQRIIVSIFAASIAGGLNSIYGAFIGAAIIAFSEVILTYQISGCLSAFNVPWAFEIFEYNYVFPMLILILFVAFMPQGIGPALARYVDSLKARFRR